MSDEAGTFTSFIAVAQIIEGLALLVVGSSSAVQIIGAAVLGFGCLTAAAVLIARRHAGEGRRGGRSGEPGGRPAGRPGARSRAAPPPHAG